MPTSAPIRVYRSEFFWIPTSAGMALFDPENSYTPDIICLPSYKRPLLSRRQKVDRIQNSHLRHAFFRAEVKPFDACNNLGDEFRRLQIG